MILHDLSLMSNFIVGHYITGAFNPVKLQNEDVSVSDLAVLRVAPTFNCRAIWSGMLDGTHVCVRR